jgi:hypothetical protein
MLSLRWHIPISVVQKIGRQRAHIDERIQGCIDCPLNLLDATNTDTNTLVNCIERRLAVNLWCSIVVWSQVTVVPRAGKVMGRHVLRQPGMKIRQTAVGLVVMASEMERVRKMCVTRKPKNWLT